MPAAPLFDENGARIPVTFNIAEMKRLTAERLRSQKNKLGGTAERQGETHLAGVDRARGSRIKTVIKEVAIPFDGCTLRELASRMSLKLSDVKIKLVELGESVDGTQVEQPIRERGAKRRGMRARLAAAKGTEGDSFIEADVAELVVLEMGLLPKR